MAATMISNEGRNCRARRALLVAAASAAVPTWTRAQVTKPAASVEVWKGPNCGCCKDWIKHLEANGFQVTAHNEGNTDARRRLGIPLILGGCHTAEVGGYAIEGHVPAREILRLLNERPQAIGLAVPAMPLGSPGMDGPEYHKRSDPYDVLLVGRDGNLHVYQHYL